MFVWLLYMSRFGNVFLCAHYSCDYYKYERNICMCFIPCQRLAAAWPPKQDIIVMQVPNFSYYFKAFLCGVYSLHFLPEMESSIMKTLFLVWDCMMHPTHPEGIWKINPHLSNGMYVIWFDKHQLYRDIFFINTWQYALHIKPAEM